MKTLEQTKPDKHGIKQVVRVANEEAARRVASGDWRYIPKHVSKVGRGIGWINPECKHRDNGKGQCTLCGCFLNEKEEA